MKTLITILFLGIYCIYGAFALTPPGTDSIPTLPLYSQSDSPSFSKYEDFPEPHSYDIVVETGTVEIEYDELGRTVKQIESGIREGIDPDTGERYEVEYEIEQTFEYTGYFPLPHTTITDSWSSDKPDQNFHTVTTVISRYLNGLASEMYIETIVDGPDGTITIYEERSNIGYEGGRIVSYDFKRWTDKGGTEEGRYEEEE